MITVKVIRNITGAPYFFAYSVGDEFDCEEAIAKELISEGLVIPVEQIETADDKKAKKAEKR